MSAKIRTKTLQNKELQKMFKYLMGGTGSLINFDIIFIKYIKLQHSLKTIKTIFQLIRDLQPPSSQLKEFNVQLEKWNKSLPIFDKASIDPTQFQEFFLSCKRQPFMVDITTICKNCIEAKKNNYILTSPILINTIDFRPYFARHRDFIIELISKLYDASYQIYQILITPDFSSKIFSEIAVAAISGLKKQIPRCDEAFDKILHSVKLLETNFDHYYKDFMMTKNPTIILENYVLDVCKTNTSTDTKLIYQFKQIVQYYQKLSAAHPQHKQVIDLLTQSFSDLQASSTP